MWSIIHGRREPNREYAESAIDLLAASSRRLIVGVGAVYVLLLVIFVGNLAGRITLEIMPTTLVVAVSFSLAYWLAPRHLAGCHSVWLLGSTLAITLALLQFRAAEVAFLYALIPMLAAVTIGWPAALISGVTVLGLVDWLVSGPAADFLPAYYLWLTLFGSFLSGVSGWSVTSSLFATIQWSIDSYADARREVEDARAQRFDLQQTQENLLQANKELSRLADRLKTMTQVAEEARRVKEEFVANVSHELRTPLNMIIGYTELIINFPNSYGGLLPARLLADIGVIQRNSQNLVELINDVLDLSQVEAGRMALTKRWASMQEIVDAAFVAVQPLFVSKSLSLEKDIPAEELKVFCDSTRIREVVLNLLSNAGRFTERGGVRVSVARHANDLVVGVSDSGPGIAPEDQKRLFEPFQQLDSALHHCSGGSGLGLSISKRFVEMHGGKMWLTSEVGQGATFHFSIPIEPALTDPDLRGDSLRWLNPYEEYYPRTHATKAPAPQPSPHFIVVEGEESLQRIFSRYLEGVEITAVKTVERGISALEHAPAQALIINTPALRQLSGDAIPTSKLPFNTPVIGCWVPGRAEAARRMGVVEYLLKPVQQDALLAILDSLGGDQAKVFDILIVDDNQEALQLFARIISATRAHYRVIRATTGREALALMRERKPDAVLLDIALPDIDGFQVLKEKGEDDSISQIPVVVISSTDLSGSPVISDTFVVSRYGGLSVREFLACMRAVTAILAPELPKYGQALAEKPPE
jgi:signal transduction histidine kinase/CheY-like chemotaxis protein